MPGNFTFAMKFAESAADCALFRKLRVAFALSTAEVKPQITARAYRRESVVKFWTGKDRPAPHFSLPAAAYQDPDTHHNI